MPVFIFIGVVFLFLIFGGIYVKTTNVFCKSTKRLDGKTVVVTGGSAGMGLQIAQEMARRGARVIVACPYIEEGTNAVKQIIRCTGNQEVLFKVLDLASFESTRKFAADILKNEDRLDILFNNAGVIGPRSTTRDGLGFIMQVNYFGTFLLTVLLLPLLQKSGHAEEPSRIVNVTSLLHWFGSTGFKSKSAIISYCNSKLYIAMFSRELAKRLQGRHVVVNNADPGVVGTKIFVTGLRGFGLILTVVLYFLSKTPWQGAQTALHVALDEKAGTVSGKYFKNCAKTKAIRRAYNEKAAMKLWEKSVSIVKLSNDELTI